jgi:putative tryptophan/tyrosine transport system substrate-binding protein
MGQVRTDAPQRTSASSVTLFPSASDRDRLPLNSAEDTMRRRDFMAAIGGAATWPVAARAQQRALPVIGYFDGGTADDAEGALREFRKGLGEAGYFEGRNVTLEYHWLEGQYDRLSAVVADLVRRRVAVIATTFQPGAIAAKAATATIPIVFGVYEDPVRLGLVASLARPGGNATGVNMFAQLGRRPIA